MKRLTEGYINEPDNSSSESDKNIQYVIEIQICRKFTMTEHWNATQRLHGPCDSAKPGKQTRTQENTFNVLDKLDMAV